MVLTLFVSISNDLLNDVIWLKPMWDIPMDQHGEKLKHQDDCLICCKILPQMFKGNSINTVKPVLRGHLWDKEKVAL